MPSCKLVPALALIAAVAPALAPATAQAPAGDADTRYCMRVEPATGSRVETVHCWTRAEWEDQGVDLDADWAKEGVRVIA